MVNPGLSSAVGVTGAVVAAVETTWAAIRTRHPDVPAVVLTLGSGTLGTGNQERLGHFAAGRWQPTDPTTAGGATDEAGALAELFIGGEGLRLGAQELLATLLHEAAHGIAHTRGIPDTSRQGRYHNARYRTLALEVGLEVAEARLHGWTHTAVPAATLAGYRPELELLAAALLAWRHPERSTRRITAPTGPAGGAEGDTGREDGDDQAAGTGQQQPKNGVVARCACTPRPRQFRITATVLETAPITCGLCQQAFTVTYTAPRPCRSVHRDRRRDVRGASSHRGGSALAR